VFDEQRVAVVLVMVEQSTDDDESVSGARDHGHEPDSNTKHQTVEQIEQRRDAVTQRMTDSHHRRVATALERAERPVLRRNAIKIFNKQLSDCN